MDGDRVSFDDSVSRRKALFGTAALGSTFALAVQPVQAQTMIVTPADGLTAGVVKVKTKDGKEMEAYRAMPATGTGFGTILVVQEIQGDPKVAPDTQTIVRDIVAEVPDEQVMGDLDSAVAFAKAEGKADTVKLGITGFCWGGRIVWLYDAHNPAVKAAVAWYGPLAGEGSTS